MFIPPILIRPNPSGRPSPPPLSYLSKKKSFYEPEKIFARVTLGVEIMRGSDRIRPGTDEAIGIQFK